MNKLRDKTHIILIVLIIAFLATIVFEWGMDYLGLRGSQVTELGSVNGEEINYQEYENQVQFAIEQQKQQTGEDPDESLMQMIREQTWEQMVSQMLAKQQIEKLGIKVTDQEILNWVYNSPQTLPDIIKRNFVDSTGQFNMGVYQQALATKTPEIQKFWSQVEDYLKQTLLSQKLQSVITGVVRVSEGDVMQKFKDDNIYASFDYILFDIGSIPDAQIQISEDDLKTYYDKNKEDLRSEEMVKMKYIMFSDAPTMDDTIITEKQLKAFTKDLKRMNDSDLVNLVNTNSDVKFKSDFVKPNEISAQVASFLFNVKKDSVSDIIKASDGFHIVRLLDSRDGENLFTNASHILINFGADTNAAKLKAEQIYKQIKEGMDFAKLASELSDDPGSKVNGGNLGWFTKGAMVKEFEQASMNAKVGEIVGPVKSQFGFHIIKVIDRQKREFKFADIKKIVKTSPKTKDAIRKRAEDFAFISGKGNFEEEAKKINIQPIDIPPITKGSFIPGAGQNKNITKFAFKEKEGTISDPFKIQAGYAVYLITEKIPSGYMKYEEIKENVIKPRVLMEKKLEILKLKAQEFRNKITGNSLTSLKDKDPQLNILFADSVSVSKPNPSIGADFDFNNSVFKLQNGQISDPVKSQMGYYLVQMKSIIPFDQEKYKAEGEKIKTSLIAQKKQSIVQDWITELKEKSDIVDNRDKFYR
ncbi:MAG: peptidylprolyl isomerase [Ignavibacteria bacterium]